MTISTYANLKTAVQSYQGRTDQPQAVYDMLVAELNERLRLTVMETEVSASISAETYSVPSDFLGVVHAYIDRDERISLEVATEWEKNAEYRSSGVPTTYSLIDGKMVFNPVPDGTYTMVLRYYTKMADFSADADTNAALTKYPQLFVYGALKHAALWAQDADAAQLWGGFFENELGRVTRRDRNDRMSSGPLRMRTAATP